MRCGNVAVRRRLFGFDEACPVHSRFKYACFGRYEMGHVYAWRWIVGRVDSYWVPIIRELGAAEILVSSEMRCVWEVGRRGKTLSHLGDTRLCNAIDLFQVVDLAGVGLKVLLKAKRKRQQRRVYIKPSPRAPLIYPSKYLRSTSLVNPHCF